MRSQNTLLQPRVTLVGGVSDAPTFSSDAQQVRLDTYNLTARNNTRTLQEVIECKSKIKTWQPKKI